MPWSSNSNDDPSGIGSYLRQQRERLAAREARIQAQLTAQYQATAQQITPHVRAWADAYSRELQRVRAATGDPAAQVSEAWIREHLDGTLGQKLTRFVEAEVNRFADAAQADVTDAASDAIILGGQDASALVTQSLSPIAGALAGKGITPGDLVDTVQGDALVGLESNWLGEAGQSRLASFWFQYGNQASLQLYQLLHGAIRSGDNPNAVAPEIRNLLQAAGFQPNMEAIAMSRALTQAWDAQMGRYLSQARTIARTELLGAYRSAQLANYRANADVVKGWTWSAAVGACPLCCDLDGTFHTLDESMDGCHVNCRCSPIPSTNSWADILGPLGIDASDIPETSFQPRLGSDWFAEQSADYQRGILGPAAFNAYQAGALRLDDLVGRTAEGQYYQRSMKSLGLDANAWLGKGPNAGVPIKIAVPGGGFTYVTPGPQIVEEPIFNMAGRAEGWAGVDAAMAGLRDGEAPEGFAARAAPQFMRDDLSGKSMADLRQMARDLGITPARTKAETIDRLLAEQAKAGTSAAEATAPAPLNERVATLRQQLDERMAQREALYAQQRELVAQRDNLLNEQQIAQGQKFNPAPRVQVAEIRAKQDLYRQSLDKSDPAVKRYLKDYAAYDKNQTALATAKADEQRLEQLSDGLSR